MIGSSGPSHFLRLRQGVMRLIAVRLFFLRLTTGNLGSKFFTLYAHISFPSTSVDRGSLWGKISFASPETGAALAPLLNHPAAAAGQELSSSIPPVLELCNFRKFRICCKDERR